MARWAAIIGPHGTGKSGYVASVVELLRARGTAVGGFVQRAFDDELGRRCYDLQRLAKEDQLVLARPSLGVEVEGETTQCSFAFTNESFAKAREWVQEDRGVCSVIVIDEVSKLEVNGRGHHEAVRCGLSADENTIVVLCVRADQLFYVVEKFGLEDDAVAVLEVPTEQAGLEAFADSVSAAV